jgi:hypothetical protein
MSNQHLRDTILFESPKGQKITELSIRGDKLALYTEDENLYRRFKEWTQLLYKVWYTQGNHPKAVDLYFPLSAKKQLLRALQTNNRSKQGVGQIGKFSPNQKVRQGK